MIKKKSLIEVIVHICLFLFFFSSSILMTDDYSHLQNILVPLTVSLIIFLGFVCKVKFNVYSKSFVLFFLFMTSSVISALINSELNLIFRSGQLFASFVALAIVVPQIIKENYINKIMYCILISHAPLILFPLITEGFNVTPYAGIFYNPNSLGTVIVTIIPIILILMYEQIDVIKTEKKRRVRLTNKPAFFICFLISVFLVFLVLISESRTSFVAMAFLILLFCGIIIAEFGLLNSLKATIPLLIAFNGVILMTPAISEAFYGLLYKHNRRSVGASGITANRADYWIETLNNSSFFGGGNAFFRDVVERSAHNTFFSILGIFGWIPLIFFLVWLLTITIKSLRLAISHDSAHELLPFFMIMSFVSLSMGEGMLMKLSMVAMYSSIGIFRRKSANVINN